LHLLSSILQLLWNQFFPVAKPCQKKVVAGQAFFLILIFFKNYDQNGRLFVFAWVGFANVVALVANFTLDK